MSENQKVLLENYDFDDSEGRVRELYGSDATKNNILSELHRLEHLTSDDCALVFFAGHGYYEEWTGGGMGYWVPYDGRYRSKWSFVSNDDLKIPFQKSGAHHILVLSDSCFSGAIFDRGRDVNYYDREAQSRSRWALTSGQKEVVKDDSPFIRHLLQLLQESRAAWSAEELRLELKKRIEGQTPDGGPVPSWLDNRGQFIFRQRISEAKAWVQAQVSDTIEAYDLFLDVYPSGTYASAAIKRLEELEDAEDAEHEAWEEAVSKNKRSSYRSYLSKYPYGVHSEDAKERLEGLTNIKRKPAPPKKKKTASVAVSPQVKPSSDIVEEVNGVRFRMKYIQAGGFKMGDDSGDASDREKPVHNVTLAQDFLLCEHPVTQALYEAVMGKNPSAFNKSKDCPVENVSWNDAQAFISKLNKLTGKGYRLPSESEWEFAARGGRLSKGFKYSGGNDLDKVGWYDENSNSETHPVGQKKANELGLYDMSGNVWEWCEDDWHGNYEGSLTDGSAWVDSPRASIRVCRGGSWDFNARNARVSDRHNFSPDYGSSLVGFRLAAPAAP